MPIDGQLEIASSVMSDALHATNIVFQVKVSIIKMFLLN